MSQELVILVVDDAKTIRTIMTQILSDIGYENVIPAVNGKDALEVMLQNKVDLIISDWKMPVCDGLDLLKAIRNSDTHSDLPFIMLTSEKDNQSYKTAMLAGATDYIKKPFSKDVLRIKLKSILHWM